VSAPAADDDVVSTDAWARTGAMSLTGPPDGPGLGPPAPLVPYLRATAGVLREHSKSLGRAVDVDPLVLLTERAAISGLTRRGQTSCGGASRLLRTADGWLALSLARATDIELVPAWLELPGPAADHWAAIADVAVRRPTGHLVERGAMLGLPVAGLPGDARDSRAATSESPVVSHHIGEQPAPASLDGVMVVDLGSLWAGPLCGSLLADAGAAVVKLESASRPDGAREGPAAFFDLLNAGKRSVAIDLTTPSGRSHLRELMGAADVVIEASRPRALEQLGIDAAQLVRDGGPAVWVSITAHGRSPEQRERVGFGDDAAVGGGLVAWDDDIPFFCADAIADPATGLVAAAAALDCLAHGGRWLLDVAMSAVARHLAGPTLPAPPGTLAAGPQRRPPRGAAPALGEHTAAVLGELGDRR
jgi:hypothetical protein